ncbi:hypothetical protein LOTGIDRAFT_156747 [Lottia gigantea]|uniref:Uncharacterized protein n=1 Tax=Lottia gigantea TaxID=225164 RepID=V4B5H6_LOTGI|nr:hypothetical protein LOTGIDRAFT_156747 [Lottia gigantea]ESP02801.1 hypothetical protein LOTGIDRAFT_156747 [Lottia gigantea]
MVRYFQVVFLTAKIGMRDDRTYLKDDKLFYSLLSLKFTINTIPNCVFDCNRHLSCIIEVSKCKDEVEIEEKQRYEADLAIIWKKKQSDIEKKLMTERGDYGDILLVNTIDIYRHLPLKLLQCHQW